MNITRATNHPARQGPADYFTGSVWIEEIGGPPNASRVRLVRVAFAPGARTAWHTHPHGQALHIVSGIGRVQTAGETVKEVHAGDTIWFDAGERHWHGAAPHSLLVHLAIHQTDAAGNSVTWLEHVTEAEYERTKL